jgi:hypothetical protein
MIKGFIVPLWLPAGLENWENQYLPSPRSWKPQNRGNKDVAHPRLKAWKVPGQSLGQVQFQKLKNLESDVYR